MKTKYCFVVHDGKLKPEDKVFMVWVGISRRDQVKLTLLQCYAEDTNAFFRIWDDDTDYYLEQNQPEFISGRFKVRPRCEVISCTVAQLYSAIMEGRLELMRNEDYVTRNIFRMIHFLDPTSLPSFPGKSVFPPATSVTRKNLKPSEQVDALCATIGFGLIIAMFLFTALLEGWERACLY